ENLWKRPHAPDINACGDKNSTRAALDSRRADGFRIKYNKVPINIVATLSHSTVLNPCHRARYLSPVSSPIAVTTGIIRGSIIEGKIPKNNPPTASNSGGSHNTGLGILVSRN